MAEDAPENESDEELDEAEVRSAQESSRPFRRIERILPEMIRKGLEKGIEAGLNTWEKNLEPALERTGQMPGAVRDALSDAKLPRELASAVFQQVEDTKNGVLRVVAREFRDFLEASDISGELLKALTALSFEIRTEIRFIPNDKGTGLRPQVKAGGKVKQTTERDSESRPKRRGILRRSERPPAPPEPDPSNENDSGQA